MTIREFKKQGFIIIKKSIKYKSLFLLHKLTLWLPFFNKKYKNIILNLIEQRERKTRLQSLPYRICLNVSNLCNLRCKFCEIHYFYWKANQISGGVIANELDMNYIKNFKNLFDSILTIELTGATGEPFLNKNFLEISDYLTNKLGVFCTATTNGTLITDQIAENLVKIKFGRLLFSIHGANKEAYKNFQGQDLDRTLGIIKKIQFYKNKYKSTSPIIAVNFLLCKENIEGVLDFLDKLKELNIDYININHYYDSRNKLSKDISFYFDKKNGDIVAEKIYNHAKKINLKTEPQNIPYLEAGRQIKNTKESPTFFCSAPFDSLIFKGCVEHANSNYITICNRILLFRLNYKEFFESNGKIEDIWNHELLQYFRKTVGMNPICRFCKDPQTAEIRCVNYEEYSKKRDKAIRDFFADFKQKENQIRQLKGLYLLDRHPYEYNKNDQF